MSMMHGVPVRESVWLTISGQPIQVQRSWRERLWSWPWRPWRPTRTVIPQIPNPDLFLLPDGSWLGHPATVRALKIAAANPYDGYVVSGQRRTFQ